MEVYASVTDARGEPATGLSVSDFHLLEDGDPQTIAAFAAGEFPLSIAIGIDRSFSMRTSLAGSKSAAHAFVTALRPEDRVMVVAIGSETDIASPLSADHQSAAAAIDRLDAWGTTPLYDAALAGFGESGGLFSQQSSPGFIELWSLQSRMAYQVRNRDSRE